MARYRRLTVTSYEEKNGDVTGATFWDRYSLTATWELTDRMNDCTMAGALLAERSLR